MSNDPEPKSSTSQGAFAKPLYWLGGVAALLGGLVAVGENGQKMFDLISNFRKERVQGNEVKAASAWTIARGSRACLKLGDNSGVVMGNFHQGSEICDAAGTVVARVGTLAESHLSFETSYGTDRREYGSRSNVPSLQNYSMSLEPKIHWLDTEKLVGFKIERIDQDREN